MTVSVVGVDLGGTKVAAASLRGSVTEASVMQPTELSSSAALVEQLVALVQDSHDGPLDGVGIGVPSVVEFESGRVVSSVNVPLADVPLRQVLGDHLSSDGAEGGVAFEDVRPVVLLADAGRRDEADESILEPLLEGREGDAISR